MPDPERITHPAVVALADKVSAEVTIESVTARGRAAAAAAVAANTPNGRLLVVVQQQDGAWVVPSMLSGSMKRTVIRPGRTDSPRTLSGVESTRVRSLGGTTEWVAIRAVAAEDAAFVDARSSIDSSSTAVLPGGDGAVLILLEVRPRERVSLTVRTTGGREFGHRP